MLNNLCIIPARGGSKRIPRKNIRNFRGKPIIAYSIEAALKSGLFEEVMVSTDDEEIAELAKKYGANVPFMRSDETSNDFATTVDVLLEVIKDYERLGRSFERICCIYPTAPFVTEAKLKSALEVLSKENFDTVLPVLPFGHPVQRSLKVDQNRVRYFYPEFQNERSQDLEKAYHDAGQFYFLKTDVLVERRSIVTDNTGVIKLTEIEAQDVDTETDWKLAEMKYELVQSSE